MKPIESDKLGRPISAINKLSKIKGNLPRLPSGGMPSHKSDKNLKETGSKPISVISANSSNLANLANVGQIPNIRESTSPNLARIRSAHPIPYDKEKLYEENLSLKKEMNQIKKEFNLMKKDNYNLELELNKKDKLLDELATDTQNSMINHIENGNDLYNQNKLLSRAQETSLVLNIKKQFKELKKDFNKKKEEYDNLKKTLKNTKIIEMTNENKVFLEEIGKLKTLYDFALQQNSNNERNVKDFMILKENFSKQEFIIINLQESIKLCNEGMMVKDGEISKLSKQLQDKSSQVTKLKKDLKFQYQINERLINSSNVKNSTEYLTMKSELEKKISDNRKDMLYFKDLSEKRDRKVRELESLIKTGGNYSGLNGNKNYNNDIEENPEEKINHTILLLKSKLQEVIKERDTYKNLNHELTSKLAAYENGNLNHMNFSTANLNYNYNLVDKNGNISSKNEPMYEYLSEFNLNEMIYILIKNFEANKFDVNIIEERILKDSNSKSLFEILKSEGNEKEFSEKLTNNILNLLKVRLEKDKKSIFSIIKTFMHNNYTSAENKNVDEIRIKFLGLFDSIIFYSGDNKQSLNKSLCKKLKIYKSDFFKAITFYDESQTGFITFTILRKILEQMSLKISHKLIEYFIYLMKCFNDENSSIHDLKYDNLFKVLKESEELLENHEDQEDEEDEEEVEGEEVQGEDNENDESAIEITTEEYLKKVESIVKKIVHVLMANNTRLEDYFEEFINKEITDFKALDLVKLVGVLNDEFNIILDSVDIYCLYTKLKHVEDQETDISDEIVDYDKLVKEVKSMQAKLKNNKNVYMSEVIIPKYKDHEEDLDYSQQFNKKNTNDDLSGHLELEIPNEDFIQTIKTFLIKNKMKFEDFILEIKDKIIKAKENRYVDIVTFENFLVTNEIIVLIVDPLNYNKLKINKNSHKINIDQNVLFSINKINLDYLKYILEDIETSDNKKYIVYKSDINDDEEEQYYDFASKRKLQSAESTESFRKLQHELLNEDDENFATDLLEN